MHQWYTVHVTAASGHCSFPVLTMPVNKWDTSVSLKYQPVAMYMMEQDQIQFVNQFRPKKNKCVFTVTCQKNLGSVGRD